MKSLLLLLSSFLATAALAQPFVSPAEISPVLERSTFPTHATRAMSLARDGDGFVAAWSAGAAPSRIYAARLNASFEPVSIRKLEAYLGEAYDAYDPDIAPIDGGYAIVWLERERIGAPRAASVIFARLTSAFEPQPATIVTPMAETGLARIVGGNADAVSVLAQANVFTLYANGGRLLTPINNWDVEDAVTRGAPIAVTSRQFVPPPLILCGGCPPNWVLRVHYDAVTFTGSYPTEVSSPAIGFGGGTYLMAWFDNVAKTIGDVNAVRIHASDGRLLDSFIRPRSLGRFTGNVRDTRPSIAWDGERFLIVWQSANDIAGASLTLDGVLHDFTLVATPADERNPMVIAVAAGRFALAYEVQAGLQQRQLAWRTVDFNAPVPPPGRRRASR